MVEEERLQRSLQLKGLHGQDRGLATARARPHKINLIYCVPHCFALGLGQAAALLVQELAGVSCSRLSLVMGIKASLLWWPWAQGLHALVQDVSQRQV